MNTPVVEFVEVRKDYVTGWLPRRTHRAVDGVSLRLEPGEIVGLLGPNRAGKTTLVKLLLSLAVPSAGTILRLGRPAAERSTLARVGYLHENHAFPRYLNARELLWLYGALSLVPYETLGPRVELLLERVGLADRAGDRIACYSKGMVQRLGLAQALVNHPDLLVLDEPTEGLDLAGRRLLREVILGQRQAGKTVLLVSHVLSEVEQLCDRVAVLKKGRLVHFGPMVDLLRDERTGTTRPLEDALYELTDEPSCRLPGRPLSCP